MTKVQRILFLWPRSTYMVYELSLFRTIITPLPLRSNTPCATDRVTSCDRREVNNPLCVCVCDTYRDLNRWKSDYLIRFFFQMLISILYFLTFFSFLFFFSRLIAESSCYRDCLYIQSGRIEQTILHRSRTTTTTTRTGGHEANV